MEIDNKNSAGIKSSSKSSEKRPAEKKPAEKSKVDDRNIIMKAPTYAHKVKPEKTDVLKHETSDNIMHAQKVSAVHGSRHNPVMHRNRHENELFLDAVPKQTLSLIALIVIVILAIVFGISQIHVSVPIFVIILVIELIIGFLMANEPSFIPILISAALMVVGALTSMFVAICIGNAVMLCTIFVVKGE